MAITDKDSLLQFFEQIVPAERWRELEGGSRPAQIYSLPVVVWMMLLQRLDERGSQQEVVHQVALGKLGRFLPDSKRVREENVSAVTGAYARACGRMRIEVLERVCDELLRELGQRIESAPERELPVLLIDGSSISLEHGAEVRKAFPAGRNQHGEAHWGILKWVVLHDVHTGIALRPAWGPMYGPEAVSEQQLAEQVLGQAPPRSVILGDGSFGVFSFAYAVAQSHRAGLFRLTRQRAKALGGDRSAAPGRNPNCAGDRVGATAAGIRNYPRMRTLRVAWWWSRARDFGKRYICSPPCRARGRTSWACTRNAGMWNWICGR